MTMPPHSSGRPPMFSPGYERPIGAAQLPITRDVQTAPDMVPGDVVIPVPSTRGYVAAAAGVVMGGVEEPHDSARPAASAEGPLDPGFFEPQPAVSAARQTPPDAVAVALGPPDEDRRVGISDVMKPSPAVGPSEPQARSETVEPEPDSEPEPETPPDTFETSPSDPVVPVSAPEADSQPESISVEPQVDTVETGGGANDESYADMIARTRKLGRNNGEPRPNDPVELSDLRALRAVRGAAYAAVQAILADRPDLTDAPAAAIRTAVAEQMVADGYEVGAPGDVISMWRAAVSEALGDTIDPSERPAAVVESAPESTPATRVSSPVRAQAETVRATAMTEPPAVSPPTGHERQERRVPTPQLIASTVRPHSTSINTWIDQHIGVNYGGRPRNASAGGQNTFGDGQGGEHYNPTNNIDLHPLRPQNRLYVPGTMERSPAVEVFAFGRVTKDQTELVNVEVPGGLFRRSRNRPETRVVGTEQVTMANPQSGQTEQAYYLDYVFDYTRIQDVDSRLAWDYGNLYLPPDDRRGGNYLRVYTVVPKSTIGTVLRAWQARDDSFVRDVFGQVVMNNGGVSSADWLGSTAQHDRYGRSRPAMRPPYQAVPAGHRLYMGYQPRHTGDSRMLAYTRPASMDELRAILKS